MQFQTVAGHHLATEFDAVQAGEEEELVRQVAFHAGDRQQGAGLGQGFKDEHAGHDGRTGEMALEEGLVDGHVLVGLDMGARHAFQHAVHQQERIAVGQDGEDALDVHGDRRSVRHGKLL